MTLSIARSRLSRRGYLRTIGSRYEGGTATPIPVHERMRKYGANILLDRPQGRVLDLDGELAHLHGCES